MTRETIQSHRMATSALAFVATTGLAPLQAAAELINRGYTPGVVIDAAERLPRVDRCGPRIRRVEDLRRRIDGRTSATPDPWSGSAA